MSIIRFKNSKFSGLWLFNKCVFLKMKYYGMYCENVLNSKDPIDNLTFKLMDQKYSDICKSFEYNTLEYYMNNKNDGFFGIVALKDEKIAGYICGSRQISDIWKHKSIKPEFYIKYVWVSPEFRGRHYARLLIDELFRSSDFKNLSLLVRDNNSSAIRSYEKTGFKKVFCRKFIRIIHFRKDLFYSYKKIEV